MIDFSVFCHIYIAVFAVIASVGPVFLTCANISMNYGLKKGINAIAGCITGDIIYFILGVSAMQAVKTFVPKYVEISMMVFCACFLLHIAYGFFKADVNKIRAKSVDKKGLLLYLKMICLTLSSPLSIVGYTSIFMSIDNPSLKLFSILLGAILGATTGHFAIVCIFSAIGGKINNKFLSILNKVSAVILCCYAMRLFYNVIKYFIG